MNTWSQSSLGLLLKEINQSIFIANQIENNIEAIILDSSTENEFYDNIIRKNGLAIKIYGSCEKNIFKNNSFINNYFDVATNTQESRNSFDKNYWSKYKAYDLNKDGYGDAIYRPVHVLNYLAAKFPELIVLLHSPLIHMIELAENAFPVLISTKLYDASPLLESPANPLRSINK